MCFILGVINHIIRFILGVINDTCSMDLDCSPVIPDAACIGGICSCPDGFFYEDGSCLRSKGRKIGVDSDKEKTFYN